MTATNDIRRGSAHDRMVLNVQNLREVGPMEAAGLVREANEVAAEFERLSYLAGGDARGWKFNREELHGRQ